MILHLKAREVTLDSVFTLKWLLSLMSVLFHLLELSTIPQQSSLIAIHTEITCHLLYASRFIWLNGQIHTHTQREKHPKIHIQNAAPQPLNKKLLLIPSLTLLSNGVLIPSPRLSRPSVVSISFPSAVSFLSLLFSQILNALLLFQWLH